MPSPASPGFFLPLDVPCGRGYDAGVSLTRFRRIAFSGRELSQWLPSPIWSPRTFSGAAEPGARSFRPPEVFLLFSASLRFLKLYVVVAYRLHQKFYAAVSDAVGVFLPCLNAVAFLHPVSCNG